MPHPSRAGGRSMIGIFLGGLLGVALLVGIIVFFNQPPAPPSCPDGQVCPVPPPATLQPGRTPGPGQTQAPGQTPAATLAPGQTAAPTPASNAAPFVSGTLWSSASLGYSFEYDDSFWTLAKDEDAFAQLTVGPVEVDIIGYPASTSVDAALADVEGNIDSFVIGRAANDRTYDALLGPAIGFVPGDGAVFAGTYKNTDGTVGDPVGITLMAATHNQATVVVLVLVDNPDDKFGSGTLQHAARQAADDVVKTFLWGGG
jgi:hypothetical protein